MRAEGAWIPTLAATKAVATAEATALDHCDGGSGSGGHGYGYGYGYGYGWMLCYRGGISTATAMEMALSRGS
ncbi:hypothetical protein OHB54_22065 [Streptomyces sp. NBC_01007]|nr:hypothetical protein OHB54_22065 [Streptomyces sp. NBC_01007]